MTDYHCSAVRPAITNRPYAFALPIRDPQTPERMFYGRGSGVGRGRGVGPVLGVGVGRGVGVAVGVTVEVGVAVGVGVKVAVAVAVGVAVGVGDGVVQGWYKTTSSTYMPVTSP